MTKDYIDYIQTTDYTDSTVIDNQESSSLSATIHFPIIFSLRLRSGVAGLSSLLLHEAVAKLMPQTVAAISRKGVIFRIITFLFYLLNLFRLAAAEGVEPSAAWGLFTAVPALP